MPNNDAMLFFNGIDGDSGRYIMPPMTAKTLIQVVTGEAPPSNVSELAAAHDRKTKGFLGVEAGVNPAKLEEAGWGVIFAHDADPALQDALRPLLEKRKTDAGDKFKIFDGLNGFRVGRDDKGKFLARFGVGSGPAQPAKVPYYLLIVGDPAKIPYDFQAQLDVTYAVGRIHFDTLAEYAAYAASVVAAEKGKVKLPRRAAFWGVANGNDNATAMSSKFLVEQLASVPVTGGTGWQVDKFLRETATRTALANLLSGGDQTPAFLFTGSHGMSFGPDSPRQFAHQGALLCEQWARPADGAPAAPIPEEWYFAGDHLDANANLLGLIAFFFACYGGGTPQYSEFPKMDMIVKGLPPGTLPQIARRPFMAQLPMKMLGREKGGALAVVAHVERAWTHSFDEGDAGIQTVVFESMLKTLMEGKPIGLALEYINDRFAALSTELLKPLEDIEFGLKEYDAYALATKWTAAADARGYTLVGDPAVRLAVAESTEPLAARTNLAIEVPAAWRTPIAQAGTPAPPSAPAPAGPPAAGFVAPTGSQVVSIRTYVTIGEQAPAAGDLAVETRMAPDGSMQTTIAAGTPGDEITVEALHEKLVRQLAGK